MIVNALPAKIEVDRYGTCQIEQEKYLAIGFGTAHMKRDPELCYQSVKAAIEVGYRILDTATRYQNFLPIKKALEGHERRDFYIISKAWHNAQTATKLKEDLASCLDQLQIDYLDAYFLHWPNSQTPIEETLHALEQLRNRKLIRHIGLSNVTIHHLKRALEVKVSIEWVQIEMNPFFYDAELVAFCQTNAITVQAAAPLHESKIDDDHFLIEIGKKYKKTAAQVALKWILQHGCIPLPRSRSPQHMQENIDVLDFTLLDTDMQEIDEKAKSGTRKIRVVGEAAKIEGFTDEFDFSYNECWPFKG